MADWIGLAYSCEMLVRSHFGALGPESLLWGGGSNRGQMAFNHPDRASREPDVD